VFGISGTELLLVGVFAFLIFGPDKIPEIARTISKAVNMFKRTQEDMERLVKAEMMGLDPDKTSATGLDLGLGGSSTDSDSAAKKPSTASSLYGIVDDEEEDEE
jgi:TatA/E family protein of Tat protein translocase